MARFKSVQTALQKFNKRRTYRKQNKSTALSQRQVTPPEIIKEVHPLIANASLIIYYYDEKQQNICQPQIIFGFKGQLLNFKFKDFTDYNLIHITGFTRYFVDEYGKIILTYRKKDAGQLWLLCRDLDSQKMLQKPRLIYGKLNEPFQISAPALAGYTLIQAKGQLRGRFNQQQKILTFYYRQNDWLKVIHEQKQLKMLTFVSCYDAPNGQLTKVSLAKGSIWQVFESIETRQGLWHCMGGNIWIKDDPNALKTVKHKNTSKNNFYLAKKQAQILKATIDYVPHKMLTLYDQPFGKPINAVADQSLVEISHQINLDGLTWLYLPQYQGWTLKQYLKFTN